MEHVVKHSMDVGPDEDTKITNLGDGKYSVIVRPPITKDGKRSAFQLIFESVADGEGLDLNLRYNIAYDFKLAFNEAAAFVSIVDDSDLIFFGVC